MTSTTVTVGSTIYRQTLLQVTNAFSTWVTPCTGRGSSSTMLIGIVTVSYLICLLYSILSLIPYSVSYTQLCVSYTLFCLLYPILYLIPHSVSYTLFCFLYHIRITWTRDSEHPRQLLMEIHQLAFFMQSVLALHNFSQTATEVLNEYFYSRLINPFQVKKPHVSMYRVCMCVCMHVCMCANMCGGVCAHYSTSFKGCDSKCPESGNQMHAFRWIHTLEIS